MELLAQAVEELSIGNTELKYAEPRKIPRPHQAESAHRSNPYASAIDRLVGPPGAT
jgi:hypothetical protein